jgi:hypothetical protein
MIPIEQTTLGGDSTMPGVRGDCLRACVASVFELPIEDVPHFVAEDDWWNAWRRWTEDRGFILGNAFHSFEDDDPTNLNGHPSEGIYWIATVKSPRLVKEDGTPGLHVVVMRGGELAWDPHPGPKKGEHLGFVGHGYLFVAPDPAQLQRRPTVDPTPVVVAARRYAYAGSQGITLLTEDAHFQLLRAVTQYNADLESVA